MHWASVFSENNTSFRLYYIYVPEDLFYMYLAKNADPDGISYNATFDMGLHSFTKVSCSQVSSIRAYCTQYEASGLDLIHYLLLSYSAGSHCLTCD